MIPEAQGAHPIGIFLLGDSFFNSAKDTSMSWKTTDGPTRLLCYHACELYLKAFLRERGEDVTALRAYGHDLQRMLDSAISKGLLPSSAAKKLIVRLVAQNDYVRVRYMVTETRKDLPLGRVLQLAEDVRNAVRIALDLNDLGMPAQH